MLKIVVRTCLSLIFLLIGVTPILAQGARNIINPRTLSYQSVTVGKSSTKFIIIANFDSSKVLSGSLTHPTNPDFEVLHSDTISIQPRTNDTIRIVYHPTSPGAASDSFLIYHDGDTIFSKSPSKIRLTGTGTAVGDTTPKVSISTAQIIFGRVKLDSSATRVLRIVNATDTTSTLNGSLSGVSLPFTISADASFSIQRGDTATFTITFTPTATGQFRDTLWIASNTDIARRLLPVYLNATGILDSTTISIDSPKVALSTKEIIFGTLKAGEAASQDIIVTNTSSTATLTGDVRDPFAPFTIKRGAGPFSLRADSSFQIAVQFGSTLPGVYHDTLLVSTNATGANRQFRIPLSATVEAVADAVSEATSLATITIFPNPSADYVTVALQGIGGRYDVRLLDVTGRFLSFIGSGLTDDKFTFATSGITPGTYFLRIAHDRGSHLVKLNIVR
jgi:hypothetical protein